MTWRAVVRIAAVALIVGGVSLATTRAYAAWVDVPQTGNSGQLALATEPFPTEFGRLAAGESAYWMIQARLADVDASTLSLQLRGWGELVEHADGLTVGVDACTVPFVGEAAVAGCPTEAVSVVETVRLGSIATDAASTTWPLADLSREAPRYLRVTLGVPAGAANDGSLQGLSGNFAVGLYAAGDSPDVAPVPPGPAASNQLAEAGINVLAAVLVAGGSVLMGATTRRRVRTSRALPVGGSGGTGRVSVGGSSDGTVSGSNGGTPGGAA